MPGPVIRDTTPDWLKPENASVLDSPTTQAIRKIVSFLGLNDPTTAATAMMAPMEAGLPGGIVGALQSLAKSMMPRGKGQYELISPVKRRIESLYQVGANMPSQANWVENREGLLSATGGDEALAERMLRLIGATSPKTGVPNNTREALGSFTHGLENPGARVGLEQAQGWKPPITNAPSKVPNINRALEGDPLSGDKVEAFSQFLLGRDRKPLDVHALHAMGSDQVKFAKEISPLRTMMTQAEGLPKSGGLTDFDIYQRVEQALSSALDEVVPGVAQNPAFATLWEGTRAFKGLKPQGAPLDILRSKGLLSKAALLDPGRLREVLKSAGWTAGAISALLRATSATSPESVALEPEMDE